MSLGGDEVEKIKEKMNAKEKEMKLMASQLLAARNETTVVMSNHWSPTLQTLTLSLQAHGEADGERKKNGFTKVFFLIFHTLLIFLSCQICTHDYTATYRMIQFMTLYTDAVCLLAMAMGMESQGV